MTTVGRSSVYGSGSPSSAAPRHGVVRHIYSRQGVIEYVSLEGEAADAGENVDDDDAAGNDAVPMSSGRPPMSKSSAASESVVVVGGRPRRSSSSSSSSSSNASSRSSPTAPAARPRSRRSSFAHLASRLMPTIQEDEELKIEPPPVNIRPKHRVSSPLSTSPHLPPSSPPPRTTTTTTMPLPPGYPVPQGQAAPAAPRVAGRAPPGYYEALERMQSEFWRQGNAVQQQQQQQQQQQRAEYHHQLQHMEQLQQHQNALYQQQLRQYEQHQARQQQQYHLLLHQHQRRQQQHVYQQQHAAAAVHVNGANMLPRALGTLPSLPTAVASSNNLARSFTMAAPPQHVHTHAHAGYAGHHAAPTAATGPHNHFMNHGFNHGYNPIFINNNTSNNHNFTRPSTTTSTTSTSSSTTLTNMPTNMHTATNQTTHRTRPFDPDAPLPPGMRGPPIISPMVPFYTHFEALALLRRRFVREQLRREGRAGEQEEELVDVRDRGLW
ncbi:uncharacterized protein J3D65DRAFT_196291 [Phyllosticta citribraziliensis]|uniref:Uncharacterized protein n=1 Tax=Phyllosticta citribraziliensis TaxID=989973 RepID=A0ABR1M6Y4_9PEZI